MPTLYVENVPEELYKALRTRAQSKRTSIAAEVIELLAEHVPTPAELARRRKLFEQMRRMRALRPATATAFPSAEEMLREDRSR